MALLTEYATFFISPFGDSSVCDELNSFLRSHGIVNVEKRLIDGERGTGWLFLVEYSRESAKSGQNSTPRIDYREVLNPEAYAVFDKLRSIRKTLADKTGTPVYTVFTNDQLAAMVKNPPRSMKDLMAIAGIGEARSRQYGEAFIKFFAQEDAPSADETPGQPV